MRTASIRARLALMMMMCSAMGLIQARALHAQSSDRVDRRSLVYHGTGATSGVVQSQEGLRTTTPDAGKIYLPAGSRVCFDVQNALSARYTYDVKTVVDTNPPHIPDFALIAAALQPLLSAGGMHANFIMSEDKLNARAKSKANANAAPRAWYANYASTLAPLASDLDSATKLVARADAPEDLAEIGLPDKTRSGGLGAVQRALLELPDDSGRIWSPSLQEDLESAYKLYKKEAGDSIDTAILEALHSVGRQFLASSKTLRSNYLDAASMSRVCDTLRTGLNTMTLVVTPRDTTRKNLRDVKSIAHIAAETPFDRKAITMSPMAMFAMVDDVPHFILGSDSTVRRDPQHESITRIGTAIHLNAWQFREDHSWVVGPMLGIGFGTGNDKKLLADLMVGGTLGYRDAIRLGFGFGQTRVPDYIKSPAAEGARLPAGTLLNDVVGTNMRQTKYIVLTLNGLNFDIPGMTGK